MRRLALVAGVALAGAAQAESAADEGLATVTVQAERVPGNGLLPAEDEPKAISAVTQDFIAGQAPTENAFQLVALLPGANVATSDPYGIAPAYSLTLRGLGQDEIGVLLQGAPQNDIGYYYAYPSQFADAENIREVALTPGSVDLDSPIINGAGGLLSVTLADPADRLGGLADASWGSYNARRGFLRLDSGPLDDSGLKGFVSYSRMADDNWRGPGHDKKQHVDLALVEDRGDGNRFTLSLSYNDAVTSSYPQPTLDAWAHYGRSYNYDRSYAFGDSYYWKLYLATFRNLYLSAPSSVRLGDGVTLAVTPYIQTGYGNSPYGTTLGTTGNFYGTRPVPQALDIPFAVDGTATVLGNFTGNQYRAGIVSQLSYALGNHTLIAGLWYDYADDHDVESFSPVDFRGDPTDLWGFQGQDIRLPDGRIFSALDDHTVTQIEAVFLADRVSLLDGRLQLDMGFKGVYVSRDGTNALPGPQAAVSLNDFQALPRAAARWQIDGQSQLFADVATSFRSPNEYALYNAYSGPNLSSAGNPFLKDEYSVAEELGYRYQDALLSGALSLFNYDFANRQITTIVLVNGAQLNETINAGGQTSRGVDAELAARPLAGFSPYVSGEFLDARIANDIAAGGDYVRSAGKIAVRSPRLQAAVGVSYDGGGLFGNLAAKYVGRQYASFVDDESLADHGELDAAVGYRMADLGPARAPEIRVNLTNLTDERSLSGVASPTTNARAATGVHGTAIAGSAPTYYIGPGFAAMLTLSSRF